MVEPGRVPLRFSSVSFDFLDQRGIEGCPVAPTSIVVYITQFGSTGGTIDDLIFHSFAYTPPEEVPAGLVMVAPKGLGFEFTAPWSANRAFIAYQGLIKCTVRTVSGLVKISGAQLVIAGDASGPLGAVDVLKATDPMFVPPLVTLISSNFGIATKDLDESGEFRPPQAMVRVNDLFEYRRLPFSTAELSSITNQFCSDEPSSLLLLASGLLALGIVLRWRYERSKKLDEQGSTRSK